MDAVIGRELDLDDLYNTPDDGYRYEILDNALVLSPPPSTVHQNAVVRLTVLLDAPARAQNMKVLLAPVAWRIGPGQVPEPDIIVAAADLITARAIEGSPELVVEILSPRSRGRDLFEKRRIYAQGGARWYWIVDPAIPNLTVLRLAGDAYEEMASVARSDAYDARDPFAVRVVPAELMV